MWNFEVIFTLSILCLKLSNLNGLFRPEMQRKIFIIMWIFTLFGVGGWKPIVWKISHFFHSILKASPSRPGTGGAGGNILKTFIRTPVMNLCKYWKFEERNQQNVSSFWLYVINLRVNNKLGKTFHLIGDKSFLETCFLFDLETREFTDHKSNH